jgi:hypothetical protein
VARDLAGGADHRPGLDLDEGADAGMGAYAASIEVREGPDGHVLAELNVPDQAVRGVVRGAIGQASADATEVTRNRRKDS